MTDPSRFVIAGGMAGPQAQELAKLIDEDLSATDVGTTADRVCRGCHVPDFQARAIAAALHAGTVDPLKLISVGMSEPLAEAVRRAIEQRNRVDD